MGWIAKRPRSVTEQILEYAESGRLIEGSRGVEERNGTITLVVSAAIALGAGLSLVVTAALGASREGLLLGACICTLGAFAILLPGIRLLRNAPAEPPLRLRPAAILPPDLLQVGNWIHRDGAWQRVEEIGLHHDGLVTALLSSGEVVTLTQPATVAGDEFRPVRDPVAGLRT